MCPDTIAARSARPLFKQVLASLSFEGKTKVFLGHLVLVRVLAGLGHTGRPKEITLLWSSSLKARVESCLGSDS